MDKKTIGARGEQAAAAFLRDRGYRIVQANYRVAGAEVDIIALCGDILCFVEVKTRKSFAHGEPEAFVTPAKQRKIIRAAKIFRAREAYRRYRVRFDVVSVLRDGAAMACDHLENAFEE
ncbi:MAG: YraN family protein [Candidatus Aminicenantes bacterium]|nr:YraN family protein [Candidatus Aminicenantes bacterium]